MVYRVRDFCQKSWMYKENIMELIEINTFIKNKIAQL